MFGDVAHLRKNACHQGSELFCYRIRSASFKSSYPIIKQPVSLSEIVE
jgi:hypothetical protein